MADIPAGVEWGIVECMLGRVLSDSTDVDRVPDMEALAGTVTLSPAGSPWIQIVGQGRFFLETLVCPVIDGIMYPPDADGTGDPGVPCVATVQPGVSPKSIQWVASFQIDGFASGDQPHPVRFDVPGGGASVDLADQFGELPLPEYVPVFSGAEIGRIDNAIDAAEEAKVAAEDAASVASAIAAQMPLYVGQEISTPGQPGYNAVTTRVGELVPVGMDMFGAVGDGVTDDTAAFTQARNSWPHAVIDLRGKAHAVSSVPQGRFTNGIFLVDGIAYPADETPTVRAMVTSGDVISSWPQDQAHHYRGIRYVGFGRGTTHGGPDNAAWLAESYDLGESWTASEQFPVVGGKSRACFAMGVLHGRQFAIVRTGSESDGGITEHRLYSRRLYDLWRLDTPFTVTEASSTVQLEFPNPHGMRTGDVIDISQAGNLNGVTVDGENTVTRVDHLTVEITGTGTATASVGDVGGTNVRIAVVQQPWEEQLLSGATFGERFRTVNGLANLATLFQSWAPFDDDSAFVGVSSGRQIAHVTDLFDATDVGVRQQITGAGIEPTVCIDDLGNAYGFTRPGDGVTGDKIVFFHGTDLDGASTITPSTVTLPIDIQYGNPAPIRWSPARDVLVGVFMSRINDAGLAASRSPIWVGIADAEQARTVGAEAFTFTPVAEYLKVASGYFGGGPVDTSPQTGVPSLDIDGDDVIVYFAQERVNADSSSQAYGEPASNIVAERFSLTSLLSNLGEVA